MKLVIVETKYNIISESVIKNNDVYVISLVIQKKDGQVTLVLWMDRFTKYKKKQTQPKI